MNWWKFSEDARYQTVSNRSSIFSMGSTSLFPKEEGSFSSTEVSKANYLVCRCTVTPWSKLSLLWCGHILIECHRVLAVVHTVWSVLVLTAPCVVAVRQSKLADRPGNEQSPLLQQHHCEHPALSFSLHPNSCWGSREDHHWRGPGAGCGRQWPSGKQRCTHQGC